jgi:hypothetical protein
MIDGVRKGYLLRIKGEGLGGSCGTSAHDGSWSHIHDLHEARSNMTGGVGWPTAQK